MLTTFSVSLLRARAYLKIRQRDRRIVRWSPTGPAISASPHSQRGRFQIASANSPVNCAATGFGFPEWQWNTFAAKFMSVDVSIRPFREDDADGLFESVRESMDDLIRWMPWCHPEYAISEAHDWIARQVAAFEARDEFNFAIIGGDGAVSYTHLRAH